MGPGREQAGGLLGGPHGAAAGLPVAGDGSSLPWSSGFRLLRKVGPSPARDLLPHPADSCASVAPHPALFGLELRSARACADGAVSVCNRKGRDLDLTFFALSQFALLSAPFVPQEYREMSASLADVGES